MTHTYPRGRWFTDLVLVAVLIAIVFVRPQGTIFLALGAGIALVLAYGFATLHFPSKVEIDSRGVAFHAYGRRHQFPWTEVERVSVRKFVVRDRVLVRLSPSPPWRGRYWLLDSMNDFDGLVRALESHGKT